MCLYNVKHNVKQPSAPLWILKLQHMGIKTRWPSAVTADETGRGSETEKNLTKKEEKKKRKKRRQKQCVYKIAWLPLKAPNHVCVTVHWSPWQTASVLMVITALSMWLQAYWSWVNQMFRGRPLLPWPSPASLTTCFKSASAPIHHAGPKSTRKASMPIHNAGPWAMRKDSALWRSWS